jgi:membrane protein implicated in regulation of membrane protease activity
MPWWGWIVLGAVLLLSETVVTSEFYLVLLGAAALTMGLLGLAGFEGPVWSQWVQFGVLSVFFLVAFRRRVWNRLMARQDNPEEHLINEIAVTEEAIPPGGSGRAQLRGSHWTVQNQGDTPLDAGARVRVKRVAGLVLHVERES